MRVAGRIRTALAMALPAAAALLLGAVPARAQLGVFQLPLHDYPLDDNCLGWGGLNPNYPRCGLPGRHVADDACAPNGTPVYLVAHGTIRFAGPVGGCSNNWGWLIVSEHEMADGSFVCAIYGHCSPDPNVFVGRLMLKDSKIGIINNPCLPHIHFGIHMGAFGHAEYPDWLLGYLPDATTCQDYPVPFPGGYVDPVPFVTEHSVLVNPVTWSRVKAMYR